MKLILVRHGETDWNRDNRVQGHSDIGLNERGKEQARCLAEHLKDESIIAIYSSPLRRAWETALAIAEFHQLPVQVEPDLAELDVGEMDGLTFEQMRSQYGDILREWMRDAGPVKMPNGESLEELQGRAWAAVQRILHKHPEGTVIVVSHNFAINTIICQAIGLALCDFRKLGLSVASTSMLDLTERGARLVLLNDTCHLNH